MEEDSGKARLAGGHIQVLCKKIIGKILISGSRGHFGAMHSLKHTQSTGSKMDIEEWKRYNHILEELSWKIYVFIDVFDCFREKYLS